MKHAFSCLIYYSKMLKMSSPVFPVDLSSHRFNDVFAPTKRKAITFVTGAFGAF